MDLSPRMNAFVKKAMTSIIINIQIGVPLNPPKNKLINPNINNNNIFVNIKRILMDGSL